ncbi:unnamed protein product [Toxocara canis]|uniref:Uncharacterized protein n=1 Tax=Toxocara canis TaxID=6265 RepID=A0A183VET9_TOXCA|nr:unnamed protein product [Toxocara canis]
MYKDKNSIVLLITVPMDADNEEELDVTVIDDAPKVATLNWEVGFRRLVSELKLLLSLLLWSRT